MATFHDDDAALARYIVNKVGPKITLGIPLGIGKPIPFVNALYQLACHDTSIQLTIVTGLTLARPHLTNLLEKRFVEPYLQRLLKNYEDPLYEKARLQQSLPSNIHIIEFYLSPGKFISNGYVQQHYISSNYTDVPRDLLYYSINVIAQQVAPSPTETTEYSLSSNTDLFTEVANEMLIRYTEQHPIAIIGVINPHLPFMPGSAIVPQSLFTEILDTQKYPALFALPTDDISLTDHAIGLHTSTLIKDDGCLQIGIGTLSLAVANALIQRERHNALYHEMLNALQAHTKWGEDIDRWGDTAPFEKGLCATTEMMSDGYLHLFNESILRKKVYDHVELQTWLNNGDITEHISADILDKLLSAHIIQPALTEKDVGFLKQFGIIQPSIRWHEGYFYLSNGERILADLSDTTQKQKMIDCCLGHTLLSGKILHAAFFLGTLDFYETLKSLPIDKRNLIDMTSIHRTNSICWSHALSDAQRTNARFVNTAMMVTLGGFVVSDGLQHMQEVSGVGGQFDFIQMASKLKNARSIITCRSTRKTAKGIESNVVFEYPNSTSPRHMRDIVITEYGIADLRSKTDSEVIKALLNITDSRFQSSLLKQSKQCGKIASDYEIPLLYTHNTSANLRIALTPFQHNACSPYPFGSELSAEECDLKEALQSLKSLSPLQLFFISLQALFTFPKQSLYQKHLERMQLNTVHTLQEWFYQKLLLVVLIRQHSPRHS